MSDGLTCPVRSGPLAAAGVDGGPLTVVDAAAVFSPCRVTSFRSRSGLPP